MPITANSPLSSSVANDTFMDRTVDTNTIGVLALENGNSESGDNVTNVQERLNESAIKQFPTASLQASDSLTVNEIHKVQYFRVAGNLSAVTLTDPFTGTAKDGTIIYIVGTDDTLTVTIDTDNSAGGTYVNGSATLKFGYVLTLVYDAELDRYLEIGRNF